MRATFGFIIRLMNHLSFPKKFIVISVSFIVPLCFLAYYLFSGLIQQRDVVKLQLRGIPVYRVTLEAMHRAAEYRDLSVISRINQQAPFLITLSEAKYDVEAHLDRLERLIKQQEEATIHKSFEFVQQAWSEQVKTPFVVNGGLYQQFDIQSNVSQALASLFYSIGQQYALSRSDHVKVQGLLSFIEDDLINALEHSGKVRSFGAYVLYQKNADSESWSQIDDVVSNHDRLIAKLYLMAGLKVTTNKFAQDGISPLLGLYLEKFEESITPLLDNVVEAEQVKGEWYDYYNQSSEVTALSQQLELALLAKGEALLKAQYHQITVQIMAGVFGLTLLLVVAAVMFIGVYRSITSTLEQFANRAEKLAEGDLTVSMKALSNDEMSDLSHAFNGMASRLREKQQQLVEAEKMLSLGHLSAGVAHEINNPVGFVLSNVTTLRGYVDDIKASFTHIDTCYQSILAHFPDETVQRQSPVYKLGQAVNDEELSFVLNDLDELLLECSKGLTRVKDIVLALQDFSKGEQVTRVPSHLNVAVEALLMEKCDSFPRHISILTELSSVPYVLLDQVQFNRVILSALKNAFDASGAEGKVIVTVRQVDDVVECAISDFGVGITPDVEKKAFDPFFTTKPVGAGTGLGLSLCYRIVSEHDGEIYFDTPREQGAKLVIRLPICPGATQSQPHDN